MDPGFFPNSPFRSPAIGPNTPVLSNGIFWTPVVPSALHAPGITSPDLLSLGQPAFSNIPIPRSLVQVDPLDSSLVPCPRCRSYNTKGKDSGAFLQRSKNTSHLM